MSDPFTVQRANIEAVGFENVDLFMRPRSTALAMITTGRTSHWRNADVYFSHTCDSEWLIKIGASLHATRRGRAVCAPSGARCELLAILPQVGTRFEQWLHWYFAGLCVEGEWFTPWPPLLDLIDRVNRVFPMAAAA
jgi:hypothetical protein